MMSNTAPLDHTLAASEARLRERETAIVEREARLAAMEAAVLAALERLDPADPAEPVDYLQPWSFEDFMR